MTSRRTFKQFSLAAFIIAAAGAVIAGAQAQVVSSDWRDDGRRSCSARSLRGAYGVKFEGVHLPDQKLNSVARITFDGAGQFQVSEKGRFNGISLSRTFSGPYVVLPDCTGALDFSASITTPDGIFHVPFVIVNEGRELYFAVDAADWQIGGVGKKQ